MQTVVTLQQRCEATNNIPWIKWDQQLNVLFKWCACARCAWAHVALCVRCVLPAAFPPVPATSDPPPSAAVVSSAVPPLTGTAVLHTAACLLPCPTRTHTHTRKQKRNKRQAEHNRHAHRHRKTYKHIHMKRNMHTDKTETTPDRWEAELKWWTCNNWK